MPRQRRRRTIKLTDPRALRAVAHPTRLALIGLLRREGPTTATRAGELLGESAASCSFHLRQLAKYGLVEEAPGGKGRERPWRATALSTELPAITDDPETDAATQLLSSVVAERYFEGVMGWLERRAREPREWQEAAQLGDDLVYLTARELTDLSARMRDVLKPYVERTTRPARRPQGARTVSVLHLAFPLPDPDGST
jgi:predicted ArsR family transcriptional regulator